MYRLNKLFRFLRLYSYVRYGLNILESKGFLRHIGLQRMWSLFFLSAVGGHWASCVFFYVSLRDTADVDVEDTWIIIDGLVERTIPQVNEHTNGTNLHIEYGVNFNSTYPQMYNRALYWAYVTMITTGFGDITPYSTTETIVCIVSMYVGVLITCSAIANLTLLVSKFDQSANDYHQKLDNVNKYLAYQLVPAILGNKIRQYYEYQWTVLKGVDENRFLNELTPQLQQQFQENLMREYLRSVDILKKAPTSLITSLLGVGVMDRIMLSPTDTLISKDAACHGLYVLMQGLYEASERSERAVRTPAGTTTRYFLIARFAIGGRYVAQRCTVCGEAKRAVIVLIANSFHRRADILAKNNKDVQQIWKKGESVGGVSLVKEGFLVENTIKAKSYCETLFLSKEKFETMIKFHCSTEEVEAMRKAGQLSIDNAKKLAKFLGYHEETHVVGWRTHFLPGSRSRRRWDLLSAFCIIWYAFELPFRMAFYYYALNVAQLSICLFIDCFFIVDFIMRRKYFPYRDAKSGLIVMNTQEILSNYRDNITATEKSLKLFCCVPFELLLNNNVVDVKYIFVLRLSKCLRLLRLQQVIHELEEDFSDELKKFDNSKRYLASERRERAVRTPAGPPWDPSNTP